ncbi:hypothetical protein ACVDFE_00235 [Lentzea chajnantorensis]
MSTEPLSEDQQDALVVDLTVSLGTLPEEEFEQLYQQLDTEHQLLMDTKIREFADNAVGSEHWDSDD